VVLDGYLSRDEYQAVLAACSIVVSTALQEFFGLSVVEAMHAAAQPVLPRRLVYPERVPAPWHSRCLFDAAGDAVQLLQAALDDPTERSAAGNAMRAATARFDWRVVAPAYDDWLESAAR
jgi:glycosyltransferase involved in cell wall biosynthesis